jgi:hypothetical protein
LRDAFRSRILANSAEVKNCSCRTQELSRTQQVLRQYRIMPKLTTQFIATTHDDQIRV